MKNKIYVSTTFAKDNLPISLVLKICNEANFFNIELGSNHFWEYNQLKTTLKYKKNKYLIHNYFPVPKEKLIVNIASKNKIIRNKSIKHAKKSIDFAKKIGANLYTLHFGFHADPISTSISKNNYDFIFDTNEQYHNNYNLIFSHMINSMREIIDYAKDKNINLAFETEGSAKKGTCFMSEYWEYQNLFNYFSEKELKLNLNIGHLNLQFKKNTEKEDFLNLIKNRVFAMEISHNNGKKDQHLKIKKNEWYWDIINDNYFQNTYKILEFRNTKIQDIQTCLKYF